MQSLTRLRSPGLHGALDAFEKCRNLRPQFLHQIIKFRAGDDPEQHPFRAPFTHSSPSDRGVVQKGREQLIDLANAVRENVIRRVGQVHENATQKSDSIARSNRHVRAGA